MKKTILLSILPILFLLAFLVRPQRIVAYAPASTNYRLVNFGFGAGGTASSSSTTYSLFGTVGETDNASSSSQNFRLGAGLIYTMIASVPAAPTFTNPSSYYNKLLIKVNPILDPSDYTYAIAMSTDGFVTNTKYVQADNTLGTSFSILNFRPFNTGPTNWGGTTGTTITGLQSNVTYTAKVTARQGFFTQSPWSATANAATINPTFSFNLTPNTVSIGTLTPGGSPGTSPTITATVSTNGTGGAIIYANDSNAGLLSSNASYTISAATADLSSASEGYGLRDNSFSQTSGGPMEKLSPYAGAGNNVGLLDSTRRTIFDSSSQPVTGGNGVFELQAKASPTTKAAPDYADTVTILATGEF